MSKASTFVGIRFPNTLMEDTMREITRREQNPLYPSFTISSFVIEAVREKIAHMRRSRGKRRRVVLGRNVVV